MSENKDQGEFEFDASARARQHDPDTSQAAAEAVQGARANELERAVLAVLRERGPLTAWQIAKYGNLEYGSTSPRLINLEKIHLVRRGNKVTVEGRRASIQWVAVHAE